MTAVFVHQNPLLYHLLRAVPALEIGVHSMISTMENNALPIPNEELRKHTEILTRAIFVLWDSCGCFNHTITFITFKVFIYFLM